MGDPVSTLSTILSNITTIVTAVIGWIGDYVGCITATGNELLFVFFAISLVGFGIGALKRLVA